MKQQMIILGGFLAVFSLGFFMMHNPKKLNISAKDRDLVISTVWAEAGNEPASGQIAVAWVIRNRLNAYKNWTSYGRVVTACGVSKKSGKKICQFEPFTFAATRKRMREFSQNHEKYDSFSKGEPGVYDVSMLGFADADYSLQSAKNSKLYRNWQQYKMIGRIVDAVMRGEIKDPTKGAFYFENRAITKKRGRRALCLSFISIGRHNFCKRNQRAGV